MFFTNYLTLLDWICAIFVQKYPLGVVLFGRISSDHCRAWNQLRAPPVRDYQPTCSPWWQLHYLVRSKMRLSRARVPRPGSFSFMNFLIRLIINFIESWKNHSVRFSTKISKFSSDLFLNQDFNQRDQNCNYWIAAQEASPSRLKLQRLLNFVESLTLRHWWNWVFNKFYELAKLT